MQEPQTITGKDIDYQYISSGEILQLLKTQKPWEWIRVFFETKNYMVQEETVFSREKLEEQVSSLNCAQKENQIAPENAYVSFANSEFTIVPETEGSELNAREAYQMISGAIDNEAADVDLGSNPKAYKKADVTKESSELQNMVNTYNNLTKANITYTFGDETVTLDGNTIKNWLQFDEKGQLLPDDGAFRQHVVDYVAQLAADHDTVGTERQFQTTSGRTVYVYGSAYGWKIDQDKEAAQFMQERIVSCIASATSSSFFRYAAATLYILCTFSSISRQKASLSPFFAFRIKISFIVVSLLLYQTGHQEILYKSFSLCASTY